MRRRSRPTTPTMRRARGGVCVRAPGFIKAEKSGTFPDVSACSAFVISCKHYTGDPMGDYTGYRIGFGTQRLGDLEPHRWSSGFKAPFQAGMVLTDRGNSLHGF